MTTSTLLTSADLIYDDETHTTRTPDGRDVPHVTRILGAVGVSTNFNELSLTSRRLADRIDYRRELGSAFHADSHAADDGDLDWSTVHADVEPYVRAWLICRDALGLEPTTRERQVFHQSHFYTGRLDGVFLRSAARKRKRIIVDLKIGDPEDSGCRWQTSAYKGAWEAEHVDQPIDERWGIQICPLLKVPYRVTNYSAEVGSHRHFQEWLAFLTTFRHQRQRPTW